MKKCIIVLEKSEVHVMNDDRTRVGAWWTVKLHDLSLIFAGVDVTANQEEISDHETFQLEFDDMSKRWYMRTMQDKYFTLQPGGGVQANEVRR